MESREKRIVFIKEFLSELNSSSINYALLRGHEDLENIKHDLDFIASPRYNNEILMILANLQEKYNIKIYQCYHHGAKIHGFNVVIYNLFFVCNNDWENAQRLKLDILFGIHVFGTTINADYVLQKKVFNGEYYELSLEKKLLLNVWQLTKYIEQKKHDTPKTKKYLALLMNNREFALKELRKIYPNKNVTSFIRSIENNNWQKTRHYSKLFKIQHLLLRLFSDSNNTLKTLSTNILWRIKKKYTRCGVLIFVSQKDIMHEEYYKPLRYMFPIFDITNNFLRINKILGDGGIAITDKRIVPLFYKPDIVLSNNCSVNEFIKNVITRFNNNHNRI